MLPYTLFQFFYTLTTFTAGGLAIAAFVKEKAEESFTALFVVFFRNRFSFPLVLSALSDRVVREPKLRERLQF